MSSSKCAASSAYCRAQLACSQVKNLQQSSIGNANSLILFLQLDCRGNERRLTHVQPGLYKNNLLLSLVVFCMCAFFNQVNIILGEQNWCFIICLMACYVFSLFPPSLKVFKTMLDSISTLVSGRCP